MKSTILLSSRTSRSSGGRQDFLLMPALRMTSHELFNHYDLFGGNFVKEVVLAVNDTDNCYALHRITGSCILNCTGYAFIFDFGHGLDERLGVSGSCSCKC